VNVTQELVLLIALAAALLILSVTADRFMTVANLLNQGRLMTEVALVALPMTFIIITGGIDLSVGSIMGLTAILLGVFWQNVGLPLPAAAGLAVVAACVAGFFNGLLITRLRVPPLIMTLATLALYRGLAEGISEARSVRGYPEWFFVLGQGEVLGVPTQLWLLVVAIAVFWVLLSRTPSGAPFTRSATTKRLPAIRRSGSTASRSSSTRYRA
jgi:rhamnose transport system permease protein